MWIFDLWEGLDLRRFVGEIGVGIPRRPGDAVAGEAAKVSRSLRSCDCCFRAELKRVFLGGSGQHG